MAENGDSTYNNANRAFLQAFLARSTLTYDQAKPIIAAILTAQGLPLPTICKSLKLTEVQDRRETLPEDVTEADFNAFVSAANNAISPFDLEIRSILHQTSRIRTYAIVNLTEDPIIQLATTYSADEIGFLKRVLDAMFETNNTKRHEVMAITSMQAMRLCKPPAENRRETQNGSNTQGGTGQGITHMQAESMLKNLVEEGWLERSRKGYYSLTPRTLMELRGWLFETYNDLEDDGDDEEEVRTMKIKQCYACKEIITTVSCFF